MTPGIASTHKESSSGTGGVLAELASPVQFGREICGSLGEASERESLVTNGIGGLASGTISGILTRRYHGLLIAALKPPLGRTLLVAKLEEIARYVEHGYPLSTDRWKDGILDPQGYRHIDRFRLDGTTPVWTFACADALLEKRIWMQQGANTTYVQYWLIRASRSLDLEFKALVNYRDYHANIHAGDWRMNIEPVEHGLRVLAFGGAVPIYLLMASGSSEPSHDWYRNFDLSCERRRGLDVAASFLQPIAEHIRTHGLGTASEIFDGDAPFTPHGCIGQAWTVGELLRAWTAVASAADAVASNVQDTLAKKVVESFKEEPVAGARKIRMQRYQDALE